MQPRFEAELEISIERKNPKWKELGKEQIKETVVSEDDIFLWNFCQMIKSLLLGYRLSYLGKDPKVKMKDVDGVEREIIAQGCEFIGSDTLWTVLTFKNVNWAGVGTWIAVGSGASAQNYYDYLYDYRLVAQIAKKEAGEPTSLVFDNKVDIVLSASFVFDTDKTINEAGLILTGASGYRADPSADYLLLKNSFSDVTVLAGDVLTVSYRFRFNY